jgi:hypothetical protein
MYLLIIAVIVIGVIYGPSFWAQRVLGRYNKREYFSGTGIDLARMLLERMNLHHVKVEQTILSDHYDPVEKVVRLSKKNGCNKTLTSIVVSVHEVGHAIQDYTGYNPLKARTKYIGLALKTEKIGAGMIMAIPFVALVTRVPAAGLLMFLGGIASLGIPVLVHMLTLPVELDASFKRALPILETGEYIPAEDLPAARKILLACALTYVASALASLLNIWRWIRILRR